MSTALADEVLLYPLSRFRQASGDPLPPYEVIAGAEMPQPFRGLLVHEGDMTSRLEAHYGGAIVLEILHREATPESYRREVVLRVEGTGLPVEYGAIEIFLEAFPEELRARIVEGRLPLGGLLNAHGLAYRSQPRAFIRLEDDPMLDRLFQVEGPVSYFGRCNELWGAGNLLLARIVEVLRP